MRVYSICRKCAEVHSAELECPACCAIGTLPARSVPIIRSRRPAPDGAGPSSFPSDGSIARRGVVRASALVVSAYLFAVVVLLIAVFARV
jgi:hypothetical protein